jgi:aldose 1-epimerase
MRYKQWRLRWVSRERWDDRKNKETGTVSFRTSVERRGDRSVYLLHDDAAGSSAAILPSYGFNLFDLRLPVAGEVRPVIVSAPTFAEAPSGPGGNGVPILFPFPNRIRDGAFAFGGRTFDLAKNNGPNAIHGFVFDRAWEVVEHRATADEAFLVGRFQLSKHAPEVCDHWPTDAVIQVRYALAGRRVTMTTTVSNPTAVDLPYGFGIHPYFRLPFAPGGDLSRTKISIPASKYWALKDFLPTGEVLPVDARLDFREGKPIQGLKLDDVLTDLAYAGTEGVCRLVDLDKGGEFQLGFDRSFRELVVYTPPGKPDVISIEPYTQTTDAINLQARGVDAGLRVLGHGRSDVLTLTMQTQV